HRAVTTGISEVLKNIPTQVTLASGETPLRL
ncbi:hypothetical protein FOQG_17002, partial [Fusarium oxysporum f. sp. raphani 54005]